MKLRRIVSAGILVFFAAMPIRAQFGKNIIRWDNKETRFYESYHFDVWHTLDPNDPSQMHHLQKIIGNLEAAYAWLSSGKVYDHNIESRIPVIVYNTHSEFEANRITATFLPEGVGAFVESERGRLVSKEDLLPPLKRAVNVHELVHVFQFDIRKVGPVQRAVNYNILPLGFFEGGAEFLAGLCDPHTRDDIRRREQRLVAANPKSLPTWETLKQDRVNPYTMWTMVFEFLETEFGQGVAFQVQGLKQRDATLGELIYDLTKGELGNPDVNPEKFDQRARSYWGKKYELDRIKRPKPYEENENFKGRSVTPHDHPYPILSPALSPDGTKIACFTIQKNGIALVVFDIPRELSYISKEDRAKIQRENRNRRKTKRKSIKNLTPSLPPEPWEYIVVQGFETWPFNGFDLSWSHAGNHIAFFARKNRDHALFVIDAENGKIVKQIELPLDQAFSPAFSPDGKKVYFSAAKNITRDLYAIDLENGEIVNLTNDDRFDTAPAVSPDGTKIIYVGSDGDFQHLFLLDFSSGAKEQLTFGRFNDTSPSWSDDGQLLVYSSDEADQVWNIYTLDLATRTVSQWTEFFGGAETPFFARRETDRVYYTVFRDDDQYRSYIYPNFEVFEARLKRPIRQYVAEDKNEPKNFIFNPTRDLFDFKLDSNQLLNPRKSPEKWGLRGGDIYIGTSTYWGMFGQSYVELSNMLETKRHLLLFMSYGSFRILDYSYMNQEKRMRWQWGVHYSQYPLFYPFYDIIKGRPRQPVLNQTWANDISVNLLADYPINKFNRWEFSSGIRRRSFTILNINDEVMRDYAEDFSDTDVQFYRLLNQSGGLYLTFGASYVRDTVLYSSATGGQFHGNALRAGLEFAPSLGKDFKGYTLASIDARTYRHLGGGSLFAGRIAGFATSRPNGDFLLMGGPQMLRGHPYGSIAGNQVAYASGELRFPFIDALVFPGGIAIGPIRGFLFADAGIARFSNERFPAQKGTAIGYGIQFSPFNLVWTRENGKWHPTFYITMNW